MENKEQMVQWLGEFVAKSQSTNKLRERNARVIKRALIDNPDVKEMREAMISRFGRSEEHTSELQSH